MIRYFFVILVNLWRIPYYFIRMEWMARHPERSSLEERYNLDCKVVNAVMKTGRINLESYGVGNLPGEGGYLLVANHQGKFDALALFHSHPTPMSFVMDDAKAHTMITSQFLRIMDGVPLVKNDLKKSLQALKLVGQRVSEGYKYLIFPEGKYDTNHNNLGEFLPGAFKAAVYGKAPIVPVALVDTYKPFEINSLRRVTAQIHYLEPIYYEEYCHMRTTQIAQICRDRIQAAVHKFAQPESQLEQVG